MAIIYSLISRGPDNILVEYTAAGLRGNFSTVSRSLLKRIAPGDSKMSLVYDRYVFHYIVEEGLTYLCMTESDFSRQIAFQYLNEIKKRFTATYGDRSKTAMPLAMNNDFSRVLQAQMDHFNKVKDSGRLSQVNDEINQVKTIMSENIDQVLQRGERIELLVERSSTLNDSSVTFKKHSKNLRNAMCWKNAKLTIIVILILIVVIYIILAASCGGLGLPKCK